MYYLRKTASIAMPSHHQNLELFQLLDTAQCRINELAANPEVHTGELKHWENTAEKAREQLILANQGLVASIAKRGLDEFASARPVGNDGPMVCQTLAAAS